MTLYILDPNLAHEHGHHLDWDLSVARVAMARGEPAVIFAHRDCKLGERDGVPIQRWFSRSCYDSRDRDPITGGFEDFRAFNDVLLDELGRLPLHRFTSRDAVWIPTLTEKHLLGYVSWIKGFDVARAPTFIVHLMFPSGLSVNRGEAVARIVDPLQALFYGLAFKRAAEPGPTIHFFGGGRQLALEFTALSGLPIEPHPIPLCPAPIRRQREAGARRSALLYSGDLKSDKGFALVPGLADRLCEAHPDWQFVVHVNPGAGWGPVLAALDTLRAVAAARPNLTLTVGRLARDEYETLIGDTDCLISTYDPVAYARKSSGVLWEAISLGTPALVPCNTWLEREAGLWSAGYLAYATHDVDCIAQRFADLAEQYDMLAERSTEASARYRVLNGPAAVMNQIGLNWAPRLLASRLLIEPEAKTLPLDKLTGDGLSAVETINGSKVRWSDRSFTIEFDWPYWDRWQLTVHAVNAISAEQITGAKALLADTELPLRAEIEGSGGRLIAHGPGGGDMAPTIMVKIVLPWTYRPDGETRNLGILLHKLSVTPDKHETGLPHVDGVSVKVLTEVAWVEPGRSFRMPRLVTGLAILDPEQGGTITFRIWTTGGPHDVRALVLFVNGGVVPLQVVANNDNSWRARAVLSPGLTAVANFAADWDLAWPGFDPDIEMIVGEFQCVDAASAAPLGIAQIAG